MRHPSLLANRGRQFMRRWLGALGLTVGLVNVVLAKDPTVDAMANQFIANLGSNWKVTRGSWQYFDVAACFAAGGPCGGNNPSSPYGYPVFPTGAKIQLGTSDALVIFLRTPPPVRYFAFTQYLTVQSSTQAKPLASLSTSLNMLDFWTLGASSAGQNLFDQYAVLVWAADMNTIAALRTTLAMQGILDSNVNTLFLPLQLPLNMGYSNADAFGLLMRTALPDSQADLDAYRASLPFAVLRVRPVAPGPVSPAPTIGYPPAVSGYAEGASFASALNALVNDIKSHYSRQFNFHDQVITLYPQTGFDCIAVQANCTYDNYDALYSSNLTTGAVKFRGPDDIVIVVGVNHKSSGYALYMNESVYDTPKQTGIVSIDDTLFVNASALYHAGVRGTLDARVKQYKGLFAYAISYDCAGLLYCINIPAPTPDNPVGLMPGSPFGLLERVYVNPMTHVRPDPSEIIRQRVLVGFRR